METHTVHRQALERQTVRHHHDIIKIKKQLLAALFSI